MPAVVRKADRSWMELMWDGLKRIMLVPWHLAGGFLAIVSGSKSYLSKLYRKYTIRRRLRYISRRLLNILR